MVGLLTNSLLCVALWAFVLLALDVAYLGFNGFVFAAFVGFLRSAFLLALLQLCCALVSNGERFGFVQVGMILMQSVGVTDLGLCIVVYGIMLVLLEHDEYLL